MSRLVTTATLSTLVISAALTLGPASAQAHAISITCGATITTDTKLTSDVLNCPENGIVIGADGITLDLNGHTVSGDGPPDASCPDGTFCDVGIDNSAGHKTVTIKRGAVQRFDIGVLDIGGSQSRIQRISTANNSNFGILVGKSTQSRIDHNSSVDDGTSGIVLSNSRRMRIDHNSITGTTGYAVPIFGSSYNRFEHNLLTNDKHGFIVGSSAQNTGSNHNEIRDNRLSSGPSIEIDQSSDNQVRNNSLTDPRDGILLIESRRTQVSGNSVTVAGVGFSDAGGFGIFLDGADDNLVQRNTVTGGRGPAIFVTSLESPNTSDRNTVTHNVVNSRLDSGILVNNNASATLVEHNTANGSHDDGIHVDAGETTVTANTTDHNLDLGIEAVPGAIDGGGNKASGNGNPAQCLNVVCK
jgi:large repetitive protein